LQTSPLDNITDMVDNYSIPESLPIYNIDNVTRVADNFTRLVNRSTTLNDIDDSGTRHYWVGAQTVTKECVPVGSSGSCQWWTTNASGQSAYYGRANRSAEFGVCEGSAVGCSLARRLLCIAWNE
jgi:hypothetical protein